MMIERSCRPLPIRFYAGNSTTARQELTFRELLQEIKQGQEEMMQVIRQGKKQGVNFSAIRAIERAK